MNCGNCFWWKKKQFHIGECVLRSIDFAEMHVCDGWTKNAADSGMVVTLWDVGRTRTFAFIDVDGSDDDDDYFACTVEEDDESENRKPIRESFKVIFEDCVDKEPNNNDGRSVCYWCGCHTVKKEGLFEIYDICEACKR